MKQVLKIVSESKVIWFCGAVFVVSLALRLYQINAIPAFIVSDEVQYLGESRAIAISGKDLSNSWSPHSLTSSHGWYAELPGVVLLPATLLFWNNPMLSAKITHVLMGSLIPLLLAGISFRLFKNVKIALFTLVLAAINPWFFQFSRLAFESFFSLFFYLLGIYLFLAVTDWKKLLAIIPFFLGFFQYQGHKLLLVPFVFLLFVHVFSDRWLHKTRQKRSLSANEIATIIVMLFSIVLTLVFIYRLPNQAASERTTQMTFMDDQSLATVVDTERRLSLANPFQPLFTNKATVFVHEAIAKFFGSFNPVYLFSGGANSSDSWAVTSKGKFFMLDVVLITCGLALLFLKRFRKGVTLLLGMLFVAPLPAMITEGALWVTFRASFIIPFLLLIAGCGLWFLYQRLPKKIFFLFVVLYVLHAAPFYYDYFYRYPVYSTNDVYFYNRVVASYLKRIENSQKTLFLIDETRHAFITILFYNSWLTKDSYSEISTNVKNNLYSYGNLELRDNCFNPDLISHYPLILVQRHLAFCFGADENSLLESKKLTIASLVDSGEVVKVYGDTFCSKYLLQKYSRVTSNIFEIEKLSDEEFCQAFFIKYN